MFRKRLFRIPPETIRHVDLDFKLINLIYKIIKLKGITYSDLAKEMKVSLSEVENMMRGTYDFKFSDIAKLENILNVNLIEINYEQEY